MAYLTIKMRGTESKWMSSFLRMALLDFVEMSILTTGTVFPLWERPRAMKSARMPSVWQHVSHWLSLTPTTKISFFFLRLIESGTGSLLVPY